MDRLDYYGCLGVDREASQEDIKRAFRRMVRRSHPDLNPEDPDAAKRLRNVIAAYHVLGNPSSRARYDCVDTLFGPRKVSRDDVADQKSTFWEERLYRQRSYPESVLRRKSNARRPFLIGVLLIWLAALLMFWTIQSEWFTRSPFTRVPRWRMQIEGMGPIQDTSNSAPDPRTDWAIEYWSKEYRLNPHDEIVKLELGRRYAAFATSEFLRGDQDSALSCARMAAAVCPDLPEARQALQYVQSKAALPQTQANPATSKDSI